MDKFVEKCIECLANAKMEDSTYEIARDVVLNEFKDQQERIDKAIKYIEHTEPFIIVHTIDGYWEKLRNKTKKDLLKILGGDK